MKLRPYTESGLVSVAASMRGFFNKGPFNHLLDSHKFSISDRYSLAILEILTNL